MTSFFISQLGSVDANKRKKMSAGLRLFDVTGDEMGYEVDWLRAQEGRDDTGSNFSRRIRETLLLMAGKPTTDMKWQYYFENDYILPLLDCKLIHAIQDRFYKSLDKSISM